ncbi:MAG: sensor histidine kinase [Bacteriovoracia bacterium]
MENELKQRLREEVLIRSFPSSVAYILFSLYLAFSSMGEGPYMAHVKFLSVIVILLGAIRGWINFEYQKTKLVSEVRWTLILFTIHGSAIFFSGMFSLIAWMNSFDGSKFFISVLIISGFATATPITLGAVPKIQRWYLAFLITPICGATILFWYKELGTVLYYFIPYVILALYATLQGRVYHKHMVQKYTDDKKLAETNRNLLEQTAMMQHSSRLSSLGEMASGLSHEINNPLTIMLGHVDILLQVPKSKEEQQDVLVKIRQSGQRIAKIIRALRTFSRQSDQDPKRMVPIQQIIDSTLEFCEQRFAVEGVSIEIDVSNDLEVYCREIHISQVLVNLLNNAFDESLRINASVIRVKCFKDDKSINIQVSNKGVLNKEAEEKIFQPFFTTKEVGKGTGLGLNISRRIAIEHGGNLKFESTEGEVKFTLSIPVPSLINEEA